MNEIPDYDIKKIYLDDYNDETRKTILSNLKNYTKLERFRCSGCNLFELPELPNSLIKLFCNNNNLTELPDLPNSLIELDCSNNNLDLIYSDLEIKTINKTNLKNRIIKRMQLLNRTLLLENSAMITMNPKRIKRLLDNHEIDFFDGSFDTLTS